MSLTAMAMIRQPNFGQVFQIDLWAELPISRLCAGKLMERCPVLTVLTWSGFSSRRTAAKLRSLPVVPEAMKIYRGFEPPLLNS